MIFVDAKIWSLFPRVGFLANNRISLISEMSDVLYLIFTEKCQRSLGVFPAKPSNAQVSD